MLPLGTNSSFSCKMCIFCVEGFSNEIHIVSLVIIHVIGTHINLLIMFPVVFGLY